MTNYIVKILFVDGVTRYEKLESTLPPETALDFWILQSTNTWRDTASVELLQQDPNQDRPETVAVFTFNN